MKSVTALFTNITFEWGSAIELFLMEIGRRFSLNIYLINDVRFFLTDPVEDIVYEYIWFYLFFRRHYGFNTEFWAKWNL